MSRLRSELTLLGAALPTPAIITMANGLTVATLDRPDAPVVSSALCYRAGRRDDGPQHGGTAHFLEHMMFRGAARFGASEIDRLTRGAGGSNNAFTTHDATLYEFAFARDRWHLALELEADRMQSLLLAPEDVDRERQVIEEEIAMYRDDPWDALEEAVFSKLFPRHPYGKPVLGRRQDLQRTDADVLRSFHQTHYRPENAVLVLAGAVGEDAIDRAVAAFDTLPVPAGDRNDSNAAAGRTGRTAFPRETEPQHRADQRLVRRAGEAPRLLIGLRGPAGDDSDQPLVDLLLSVLATGRSSRLQRKLVDGGQLCAFAGAQIAETLDPGAILLSAEVLPGVEPQRVEEEMIAALTKLAQEPPSRAEIRRARRMLIADWIFGHERVHQQAVTTALAMASFDAGHPLRQAERLLAASPEALHQAAQRWLDPAHGTVVGWSLPTDDAETEASEGR